MKKTASATTAPATTAPATTANKRGRVSNADLLATMSPEDRKAFEAAQKIQKDALARRNAAALHSKALDARKSIDTFLSGEVTDDEMIRLAGKVAGLIHERKHPEVKVERAAKISAAKRKVA